MLGSTSRGFRWTEPVNNSSTAVDRATRPRALRIDRFCYTWPLIPGSEGQLRQSSEHLCPRLNISGLGLCERPLGSRNVQQAADARVVSFKSCGIGLTGCLQQCNGGLPLSKGGVQTRVSCPNLVGNLIACNVDLCFCRTEVGMRVCQIVLSCATVKQGPLQIQTQSTRKARRVCVG